MSLVTTVRSTKPHHHQKHSFTPTNTRTSKKMRPLMNLKIMLVTKIVIREKLLLVVEQFTVTVFSIVVEHIFVQIFPVY